MVRFPEIFCVKEEGSVHDHYCVGFGNSVKFRYRVVKTVEMFQYMAGENFVECIIFKWIGKCINIMDHIAAVIHHIKIYITFF